MLQCRISTGASGAQSACHQDGKKREAVAIRVNPNIDADTHQYITTGKYENKFGISYECLFGVIEFIEDSATQFSWLHFHIGSQI